MTPSLPNSVSSPNPDRYRAPLAMELRRVHESNEANRVGNVADSGSKESEVEVSAIAIGSGKKNGGPKENGQSTMSSFSKIVSQIKKPQHRRSGSPINWFPRKKTDSFLKRKIKLLQETDGMNLPLDETLGKANPHYTRIAKEKIAAREAAKKAMEARKAALVEASWCRILRAARPRIRSEEAEAKLEKAEKYATEAFEAARYMGVMMYDKPHSPRHPCDLESNSSSIGGKSTHSVSASFKTAFEVDKEVMAAVKNAFIQLANCHSSLNKEEFRDLLWKISQNPDNYEDDTVIDAEFTGEKCRPLLINAMLDRLKCLLEDELASLATIVATCGLNAALLELERSKDHVIGRETSTPGTKLRRNSSVRGIPSLDKFLVKHVSRLEREVQEARNSKQSHVDVDRQPTTLPEEPIQDLGSILVKHVSKLQKEIQVAKSSHKNATEKKWEESRNSQVSSHEDKENLNSNTESGLDKILVKPVHWLEREKMRALEQGNEYALKREYKKNGGDTVASEGLDKILVKHVYRLEKERNAFKPDDRSTTVKKAGERQIEKTEGLDEILVKHQWKLEKAKLSASQQPAYDIMKQRNFRPDVTSSESLDKILVRPQPEPEKAKLAAARQSKESVKHVDARKEVRERELQEAWGGLSLGNSIRPHISRLERDRAAWKRAEDEEQMLARGAMK